MANHGRSNKDAGKDGHAVVRTYFLDKADNLSSIASAHTPGTPRPPTSPPAPGEPREQGGLDPRQEKWIEICDSHRRYQARLEPAARLSRNPELRRRLLALFGEEQRQPIAALLDFADLFRKGAPGGLALGFETRQILESVDLLCRRIDDGQGAPAPAEHPGAPAPAAVATLADTAIEQLRDLCRARNLRVQNHLSGELACASADGDVLRQSLLNLLVYAVKNNNALRHVVLAAGECADGAPAVRLCFTCNADLPPPDGGTASRAAGLQVSTYELEGSDLPLLLSDRLLDRMGAALRLERFEGYGCAFEIRLPPAAALLRGKAVPVPGLPVATGGATMPVKVLYIEDNPDHLVLMRRILQKVPGTTYLQAGTPELGLALAQLELPDIVLLDIRLPRMNGLEVLRQLRASPRTAGSRVLALSASAFSHDIETGRLLGFRRYITKPFSVAEFVGILEQEVKDCLSARRPVAE